MTEHVFLPDGRVCLPSNADPAATGHTVYGWLRHRVGMDLGRNDPSAIVVLRDECFPEFTGRGFQQRLGPRRATVVFQETIQLYSYADLADHLARRLGQIPNWSLAIDSSGLGQPFSSMLNQAGIDHWACTMTAGASLNRKGRDVTVAKSVLVENLAVGLETGALTVADDLPGKSDLLNEIASFELQATSSGNLVLAANKSAAGHADRAIAAALAYLQVTHLDGQEVGVHKIANWF